MKIGIAENECMRCMHQWKDKPGSFAEIPACPKCGSLYWKWLNFDEFKR